MESMNDWNQGALGRRCVDRLAVVLGNVGVRFSMWHWETTSL